MKSLGIVVACLAVLSATAITVVNRNGWTLFYGDAESHLDIARRIVDSRTPGYDQIGTAWLPLTHALMIPLVKNVWLWRSGLAGAIPSGLSFVLAGAFLFASVRRLFGSVPTAAAATGAFALNPNLLYLQSTPMSEPLFFASLMALLYCTVTFRSRQALSFVVGAGAASAAGCLTRYDGWFLIPFVTLYFMVAARRNKVAIAVLFGALACLAPLYWLAHNWWYFGNALDFYNGPYSAKAIQGAATYPGFHDWANAWLYYRTAAFLSGGSTAFAAAAIGLIAMLGRRAWWPLLLFMLPPVFYMWSLHSSGNPIFVPSLWPNSYYNSRYGLAAWPLLAVCAGSTVLFAPERFRRWTAVAIVVIMGAPWIYSPRPEIWVCWKESQVNSVARRDWTRQAADYLAAHYNTGVGIFGSLGDFGGVYREAGIPFREVLQEGNEPAWMAAAARPDLFLNEGWAVAVAGDSVSKAASRMGWNRVETISVKGAPAIEIYRKK